MLPTVGQMTGQTPHFSLLRRRLERCANGRELQAWLIDEANRRGFHGAFNVDAEPGPPTAGVTTEELIVGLLMPHAEADARTWKLVVRILQRGPVEVATLVRLARMERADVMLAWLLGQVPVVEQTPSIVRVRAALPAPRHRGRIAFSYEPSRLIRRPATKENLWRPKPT